MGKDGFDDDLQGFAAFAPDGPARPLERRTLGRMPVPGFCAFRRKGQNAWESALAFPDGMSRAEAWPFWAMAATVSGRGAHFSTLFIPCGRAKKEGFMRFFCT